MPLNTLMPSSTYPRTFPKRVVATGDCGVCHFARVGTRMSCEAAAPLATNKERRKKLLRSTLLVVCFLMRTVYSQSQIIWVTSELYLKSYGGNEFRVSSCD